MDSISDNWRDEIEDVCSKSLFEKCLIKSIAHPIEYARFLVKIGHEPFPPYNYRSIFGLKRFVFPSLIVYAKHIYSVDGFKGMYTGLFPMLLGTCVEHYSSSIVYEYIKNYKGQIIEYDEEFDETWKNCSIDTSKEMICTATSIILSHPFYLVSMRMMAQFISYKQCYKSVLQSLILINQEEGVSGLFSGIIPRLLKGLVTVILINVTKQAITHFFVNPAPLVLSITDAFTPMLASTATYPFNVVTACTAISNCGLTAGMPPDMPVFGNWLECMTYLYRFDQLNRGSTIWLRCVPKYYSFSFSHKYPNI